VRVQGHRRRRRCCEDRRHRRRRAVRARRVRGARPSDAPARHRVRRDRRGRTRPRRADEGSGVMRLSILNSGHTFGTKMMFAMIRLMSGRRAPDVVKTLTYRPDFFGAPMREVFQEAMRGESQWSIGDREMMASFVSKMNECEF